MTTSVNDFICEHPFSTAKQDAERHAAAVKLSPQMQSAAYRLAYQDYDFMMRDELRHVRLQLELLKPDLALNQHAIEATIVIFGSARTQENHPYYQQARELGALIAKSNRALTVVTGGGGGIMEAANRGAFENGGKSVGFNVALPHEQIPNPYITPDLCFQFHYFAVRKMHLLMRAKALVAFPGGFGTLDELFEALTLVQTQKMRRIPIVLFDKAYWQKIINFDVLVEERVICAKDLELIQYAETAEQAWELISNDLPIKTN
jgi:uncharacterized protein (TIGR00730 family)